MTTQIKGFRGEFEFLSNFYDSVIYVDGDRFPTVEHAYQASKTLDPWSRRMIRNALTPGKAKQLGKGVKLRPDWEEKKVEMMRVFVQKKFENPFLGPMLLETGDAEIIEENTWGDREWGVCKGEGKNLLGKILMSVRDELRQRATKDKEANDFKE